MMRFFVEADLAALLLLLLLLPPALSHPWGPWDPWAGLPVVDLGYEVHQASNYNETSQLYNFSNIRYAQPPVGKLRWAEPQPPEGRNSTITTGPSIEPVCPQSNPLWYVIADEFVEAIANGTLSTFNLTAAIQDEEAYAAAVSESTTPDPRQTEDCLFLDVVVPAKILNRTKSSGNGRSAENPTGTAPVLVWIYGGGYVGGSKRILSDPSGLIQASNDNIIFVAMNYRLGALGFMAGNTLKESGGVPNAGFYDQRLAIEWVSKYIHLFGGDKNQVTLMGESAGGGSITHQITAFAGERPVSFQRAIPQSPAFQPSTKAIEDDAAASYLNLLNVSTFDEARALDSSIIIHAQTVQGALAPYGQYYYGPAIDGPGGFAPKTPGELLANGQFAQDITVMSGHNTYEGQLFTPPQAALTDDLSILVREKFPFFSDNTIDYIVNNIYPPVYDGTYPWTSNLTRAAAFLADSCFTCNNNYLNKAFGNKTWAYEFQVPPAFHGFDVPYTFWDGYNTNPPFSSNVAAVLQGYIANFVMKGDPNSPSLPVFPIQGYNASMNGLNTTSIRTQSDPTANQRCVFWQHAFDT